MSIRKIAHASAFVGAFMISLWASAASSQPPATIKDKTTYAPIESIRYDFGSKSMSGYFVDQAARCVVMLMVSEKGDPDSAFVSTATRVRLMLNPGETAGLDSEEGRSINLTCGESATTVLIDTGERDKLMALQALWLSKTAADLDGDAPAK
jgi:hypothetical protein